MLLNFSDTKSANNSRKLSESDAIDVWIARWLRIRQKDIRARYDCDPRRLYEIWNGTKFPGSREKALKIFSKAYPQLLDRIDFGHHQTVSYASPENQLVLFD